jgi:hypothetical protein
MPQTIEYEIGTSYGTLFTNPPNYSFDVKNLIVSNSGTVNDRLDLIANPISVGTQLGTISITKVAVPTGQNTPIIDSNVMTLPAGAAIMAKSANGNIKLTVTGEYIFYRE